MPDRTNTIITEAMRLTPTERALVADRLIASLGLPEKEQHQMWTREADRFMEAFERGTLNALSAKTVSDSITT